MHKRERLEATINGEAVDRPAISLWRHWPGDDQRPDDLATAHLRWQEQHDWDFVRVTPANTFCLRSWGLEDRWQGDLEGKRHFTRPVVVNPEDWTSLKVLNPTDGTLGEQLLCLTVLQKMLPDDTPFVQTIYNPLAQAKFLAGDETLVRHMRQNAGQIHHALQTITDTTIRFIQEARKRGIAGVFYVINHANYNSMAESEYEVFGRPYDLQVLRATDELWFNIAQIENTHPMFHYIADYPVHVVNWPDRQSPPTLGEGVKRVKGAVCGGIDRWALHDENPEAALSQARDAVKQTGGKRVILSVDGSMLITTPEGNIRKLRKAVESMAV